MDRPIVRAERNKGNTGEGESFRSLFLLQSPVIDSSNGTSLNTTLISGSKKKKKAFQKHLHAELKP